MAFISIHRYLVPYTREIHPEARLLTILFTSYWFTLFVLTLYGEDCEYDCVAYVAGVN